MSFAGTPCNPNSSILALSSTRRLLYTCIGTQVLPGGSVVKNLPANEGDIGDASSIPLRREDPLEGGIATHSSILAWRIPLTEEPGELQSMGHRRVRHDRATNTDTLSMALRSLAVFISRKCRCKSSDCLLSCLTLFIKILFSSDVHFGLTGFTH